MNRKEFIAKAIFGIAAIPMLLESCKDSSTSNETDICALIPEEDTGPYVLDLASNPILFRRDITEGKPGIPLNFTFKLFNVRNNCAPIVNARVDVWHCDKEGLYSGFKIPDRIDTTGQTFFRGIQLTDKNGHAVFKTIYPGWYQGRTVHIHFKVHPDTNKVFTSQLFFDDSFTDQVFTAQPYAAKGTRNTRNVNDGIYEDQLLVNATKTADGYAAPFDIGMQLS